MTTSVTVKTRDCPVEIIMKRPEGADETATSETVQPHSERTINLHQTCMATFKELPLP